MGKETEAQRVLNEWPRNKGQVHVLTRICVTQKDYDQGRGLGMKRGGLQPKGSRRVNTASET